MPHFLAPIVNLWKIDWFAIVTLILSAVTPWFVIQVSDRRVTNLLTGKLMDSNSNKAILFSNRIVFGYTGLAELEGFPTVGWLVSALSELPKGVPLSDLSAHIARKAEIAVRGSAASKSNRHLAFAGVGWAPSDTDGKLRGVMCTIDNFVDDDRKRLSIPRPDFRTRIDAFSDRQSGWHSVGIPLNRTETIQLNRRYASFARRGLGPFPIMRSFADLIRAVAKRSDKVGKDLMVTAIPKSAAESDIVILRDPVSGIAIPLSLGDQGQAALDEAAKNGPDQQFATLGEIINRHLNELMFFGYMPADSLATVTYTPAVIEPGGTSFWGATLRAI